MEHYGSYGEIEARIERALSAMHDDPELKCAEAARQFFVPYPRLYARLKQRDSKFTRPRTNLRLTEEQDQALQEYVYRCDKLNSPALVPQLLDTAERILRQCEPEAAPLGKNWIMRYLQRNPHLHHVRQKPQELERMAADEIPVYKRYFREFKAIVNEKGIPKGDIYNMDEMGFRIGVGGNQWVITMDWKRPQTSPSDTNWDYITSVEVVSADGEVLPPLLIVQGTDHLHQWYTNTSLPDNYLVGTSKSGYSNDTLSIDWLRHFDNWSRWRQQGAW